MSFSLRFSQSHTRATKNNSAFTHQSKVCRRHGEPYAAADVIGCYLWQPGDAGSGEIWFFKNGVSAGVAFADVPAGHYYPAVSMFGGATAQVNFGPEMSKPPHAAALPAPWVPASKLSNSSNKVSCNVTCARACGRADCVAARQALRVSRGAK